MTLALPSLPKRSAESAQHVASGMTTAAKHPQEAHRRLEEARKAYDELQGDLPRFEQLLADNQQAEQATREAYRAETAPFEEVRDAMAATHTARELLEQHRADIQEAAAALAAAETAATRADGLAAIQASSEELRRLQRDLDKRTTAMLEHLAECCLDIAQLQNEHAPLIEQWRQVAHEKVGLGWQTIGSPEVLTYLAGEGVDTEPLYRTPQNAPNVAKEHRMARTQAPLRFTLPESVRALLIANGGHHDAQRYAEPELELSDVRGVVERLVYLATIRGLEPAPGAP